MVHFQATPSTPPMNPSRMVNNNPMEELRIPFTPHMRDEEVKYEHINASHRPSVNHFPFLTPTSGHRVQNGRVSKSPLVSKSTMKDSRAAVDKRVKSYFKDIPNDTTPQTPQLRPRTTAQSVTPHQTTLSPRTPPPAPHCCSSLHCNKCVYAAKSKFANLPLGPSQRRTDSMPPSTFCNDTTQFTRTQQSRGRSLQVAWKTQEGTTIEALTRRLWNQLS